MEQSQIQNCEHYNIFDELKSLTFEEVIKIQKDVQLPFAVAVMNVNSDLNLGILLRTAVCFAAERFFIFGKRRYDKRTTVGAHNYIDVQHIPYEIDDPFEVLTKVNERGYTPFAIEQGGDNIYDKYFTSSDKPCLLLGSEHGGIPPKLLSQCQILSIPQFGVLRSLNVGAAGAIAISRCALDLNTINR